MLRYLVGLILLSIALTPAVSAQEVTGTIVGTVVDASKAAVPGATVTVTSTDRGLVARIVTTDSAGGYVAPLLPIGNYSVKVEMTGFKGAVKTGIELHVNDKLTFDFELEVGTVAQQVVVEESVSAVAVELQTATAASLVSGAEVLDLSLNNRNYIQLISLMPGATNVSATDEVYIGTTNPTGGTNTIPFAINGGRNSASNFMVDGADNVDRGSNLTLLAYPSVDAIAEFKAVRGQYTAEFGRGASGQINVVTKSGTSKYHGDVYEFLRNDATAANNFFNNSRSIKRPPLRWNDFGYTFSGPIPLLGRKDADRHKTFFFWSQEFRRIITYSTFQSTVPSNDMKQGIFSQPVCVEYTGSTCTRSDTRIPSINPVAAAYIKDIWSKIPQGDASYVLFTAQRSLYNYRQELIKIDHVFSASWNVSARYIRDAIPTMEPGGLFTGAVLPGVSTTTTDSPGRGWVFRATGSLSPTLLNEAGYSFSYGAIVSRPTGLVSSENSPDVQTKLPFKSTLARVPALSMSPISTVTGFGPYDDFNRNHNIYDNLTKLMGRHTLKVGVSVNFYQKTENAGGNNAGTFTFASTPRPTGTSTTQQAWANFLLGNVSAFTQASLDLTPDIRQKQFETYIQEDYRVRPNLTVNLGVRFSQFYQPRDANDMLTNFDGSRWTASKAPDMVASTGNLVPNTGDPLNGIIVNGQNSPYGSKASNEDLWKFAPRLGFAWDPFKKSKTAIRAGYGLVYDSTLVGVYEQNIFTNPPFVNSVNISNTRLEDASAGVSVISAAPKTLRGTPQPTMLPYSQQYSFEVQHRFGTSLVMALGYYGSKSTHLLGMVDMNMIPPGLAVKAGITDANTPLTSSTTPRINIIRPYRGYGPINQLQNWFDSNYNSLQYSMQKQFSASSSVRVAYTWSKVLTNAPNDRSNAPQDPYNRAADRARASFDRAHVLTLSYIYQLPFAAHSQGIVGKLAKGWQFSGITSFASGLPLRVTSGLGLDWGGGGIIPSCCATPRPDMLSDPNKDAPHTIAKWFNTQAFAAVPTGVVRPGNAPATSAIGPGYQRWDVSLFKVFAIREGLRLQFRAETFNLPNHTNFQGVSTSMGSSNYGQITSTREARRMQLALKLLF
jgi:hypothetical protein